MHGSFDLGVTNGIWKLFEKILVNPLKEEGEFYINLRFFGTGTIWFSDIRFSEVE